MPADPEARAGLFRYLVADRRMLIVLDNARDAAQIRPLLPGGSACLVVVTSRNHLGPLAITHGSRSLALDTLGDEEAREVLARAVGHDRTAAEPGAVAALLRRCAGLPLALGIVASRAAARPDFPLTALAEELDDATGRLDALNAGDLTTDLRAVFDTSHRALDEPAAEVFALLGLAPGPDIDLFAAAALTALPPPRARIVLRALETAHLVQQHTPGRYRMHDLVRLYAAERGHARPPEVRVAARRRLVDFHLHTARTADRLLFPHRPPIEVDPPSPGCTPRPLEESTAARWFDDERLCLLAAQELALDEGWDRRAWQLAWTADLHHRHRGHVLDGLAMWRAGLTAAERLGDPAARATAHWLQGRTRSDLGEYALALDHLRRAQELFRQVRDRPGEAHAHRTIARTLAQQGEHRRALVHARQALDLYRTLDNTVWEANALNAVGWYLAQLGDHEQARSCCARALALFREEDYRVGEASALDSLGFVAHRTGLHAEALDHYRHALRLCRETDNDQQAADALYSLGAVHRALGRDVDARLSWRQALALYRDQHRTAKAQRIRDQLDALDRASAD
ncbi:tetratricopeptide repeat protein [Streptomyces caniscabiei]|uniref:tetratricopeptide repeat protein n=1 Tax=Streptomyces caniscabiei TaxID=2746961 RepID=UPI0029B445CD|nr:tetratricopeptide repeat protein [Streptomyces caniscabiei]MDX2605373.1 tetratricopeptide repeat protein [Streptomyces caniscabiei]MDX2736015.1 tetratricopeptide repeat protein [Streptomyces caniscabiei]MDX2782616.1 tetratricopeptide repeat protein [Streptomyces caniscabiei]